MDLFNPNNFSWGMYYRPHFTDEETDDARNVNTMDCGLSVWRENYLHFKALTFLLHYIGLQLTQSLFLQTSSLLCKPIP